jgi:prophage regulatory protein
MTTTKDDRAMRLPELVDRLGMSRSWVYEEIAAGRFPKPVKIGARASVWLESEVADFLAARARERRVARKR